MKRKEAKPNETVTNHEITISGTRFLLNGKPFSYHRQVLEFIALRERYNPL